MAFMDTPAKRQQSLLYFGAALLLFSLLTFGVKQGIDIVGADPTTTTTTAAPAPTGCGTDQVFFARETSGNQFGPAAPETDADAAHVEFASRRCRDAMLFVADEEYLFNEFTDAPTRVQKTIDLMENPEAWALRELRYQNRLNEARREIAVMEGPYQTMDAEDQDRMIPEVYQIPVEAAPFKVLRYTFPDGTVKNFKLNCGFQPVEQNFPPSVPGKGAPASPNQPSRPVTPGKPGKPGTTPTTTPQGKCWDQIQNRWVYCGTPDSGPELDPVNSNPQPGTPGYVPGNAEEVINQQNQDAADTLNGADPYRPTEYGQPGTGTGSGVTTPSGATDGPSGTTTGGSAGASNPDMDTNVGGQTNDGVVTAP